MPVLSRWFVRTALLCLLAALGLAVLTSARGGVTLFGPTVLHLLVIGWLSQMVFGVAYWLFPTRSGAEPRGRAWLGWLCYLSLNIGLLLRVWAEPSTSASALRSAVLLGSAALQLAAAIAFVVNTWPRVRERG